MPFHVVPILRAIEECREATNLYPSFDTVGVTLQKAKESAGTQPKVVPVVWNIWWNSQAPYTAI